MMNYRNAFKRFGGEWIPDVIEYLKEQIKEDPYITISVGCDSVQKRKKTMYACTIMIYNHNLKNGAHVIFFRLNIDKIRDNHERLHKECQIAYDIAEFLNSELETSYKRMDIDTHERKNYKLHLLKCMGQFEKINTNDLNKFIDNIPLTDFEKTVEYKLVDIHLDFNPFESTTHSRGKTNNKSNVAYKAYVPWLRGLNYRTWVKPNSHASTSAADLLLQD